MRLPNLKKIFHFHIFLGLFLILLAIGLYWWNSSQSNMAFNFVFGKENILKITNGRVNILLLGIPGPSHDGPNLTDTIMVASYDIETSRIDLISLPRDLWLDEKKAKVNTLYQISINRGQGLSFAQQEIGSILGMNIPYAVRVDFNGFIKAVDLVGGLDINVATSFDDYVYPLGGHEIDLCGYRETEMEVTPGQGKLKVLLDPTGKIATSSASPQSNLVFTDNQVIQFFPCRFEHLTFTKGETHMDGDMALKFVRSRHGTNGEGSDFARSKRQELVLQAFKGKILSFDTLTNLQKITDLVQTFGSSIDTNIPKSQYLEMAKLIQKNDVVKSYVIDGQGTQPLLITPPVYEYGAWVLIPPDNDFSKIQKYVSSILQ